MNIRLLVTDLDNTLYDWVTYFVPAFYAMMEKASALLSVPLDELLLEMKAVHQRHESSEHPFSLLDAPIVQRQLAHLTLDERKQYLNDAFHAFNKIRKQSLKLYDGVYDTLQKISRSGAIIVAHTDADTANALYRIVRLGLAQVISRLYAPQKSAQSEYKFGDAPAVPGSYVRALPREDRKPNPKLLQDICRDYDVDPAETLYIGDSRIRDVLMANNAGVHSALALYGANFDRELWQKLVRVSHWTEADVKRENELLLHSEEICPDVELAHFSDLLTHFSFGVPKHRGIEQRA